MQYLQVILKDTIRDGCSIVPWTAYNAYNANIGYTVYTEAYKPTYIHHYMVRALLDVLLYG